MNDLDLMEKFRADVPPADRDTLTEARARMFQQEPAGRSNRARWAWRLAPAAALAVAVAVVAVAARPGDRADPEAARVLRLAAAEALTEPVLQARPDQFVYVRSLVAWAGVSAAATTDGNGPAAEYVPPAEKDRRVWLSVDGSRAGLFREKLTQPAPAPANARVPVYGNMPLDRTGAGYAHGLPTDAKAMRAYIYRADHGDNPPDSGAWTKVGDLLREQYVPPASVAALFEAAATIPGTTVVRQVDLAGRHGIAVSRTERGIRHDLIFDAGTYHYLGERDVAVDAGPPFPKNAIIGYTAQLQIAVVNDAGQLP